MEATEATAATVLTIDFQLQVPARSVAVDGVGVAVVVGGGGAAVDGVGLEEPAGVGVVEADAHEDDAAEGFGGALFAAEPAVAGLGLAAGGDAELVELVEPGW